MRKWRLRLAGDVVVTRLLLAEGAQKLGPCSARSGELPSFPRSPKYTWVPQPGQGLSAPQVGRWI